MNHYFDKLFRRVAAPAVARWFAGKVTYYGPQNSKADSVVVEYCIVSDAKKTKRSLPLDMGEIIVWTRHFQLIIDPSVANYSGVTLEQLAVNGRFIVHDESDVQQWVISDFTSASLDGFAKLETEMVDRHSIGNRNIRTSGGQA